MTELTVGSLFSGIGGFELGAERAGFHVAWQSEIDPKASRVLAHRWPKVRNYGDITAVRADRLPTVDVLCGGFPCQDLSVAGNRAGLAGERSGLWWEFHRCITELRPRWVVIENVPGLLSSNGTRDLGTVLGALGNLGYGWAYRVMDAQWSGLAQRRKRVFIVGHSGDWRAPATVLFEPDSVLGADPPCRPSRQDVAATLGARTTASGTGYELDASGAFIPMIECDQVANTLGASMARWEKGGGVRNDLDASGAFIPMLAFSCKDYGGDAGEISPTLRAMGHDKTWEDSGQGYGITPDADVMYTLDTISQHGVALSISENQRAELILSEITRSLTNGGGKPGQGYQAVIQWLRDHLMVRRLTPLEWERLQGFEDDWTLVPNKEGKPMSDSARYKMLGNAVAVPVAAWLFGGIARWEATR